MGVPDGVLQDMACRYRLDPHSLYLLGGLNQNVYEGRRNGRPVVLKFQDDVPSESYLEGEIEWVQYLAQRGLAVCPFVPSASNRFIESLQVDHSCWYVTVTNKAHGRMVDPSNSETWNSAIFRQWGRVLGQMHQAACQYKPTGPERPGILDSDGPICTLHVPHLLGDTVAERWQRAMQQLHRRLRNRDSFGMIHHDLHHGNLLVTDDGLTVLDFGDCIYGWYMLDVAIALFHGLQDAQDAHGHAVRGISGAPSMDLARSFLSGYQEQFSLPVNWKEDLEWFLSFRRLYSLVYFSSKSAGTNLERTAFAWLQATRRAVEDDLPIFPECNSPKL